MTELSFESESWPLREPFHFAGYEVAAIDVVHVVVARRGHRGCGEGVIPIVFDVTMHDTVALLMAAQAAIAAGQDAESACAALPAGPARNALDCALWDLHAKSSGSSIWQLAGLMHRPARLEVDQTIGLASPEAMAEAARASTHRVLKIKLDAQLVSERVAAIRAARPDAKLIVDANQSWNADVLQAHCRRLADLGIEMIEQPLPVHEDEALRGVQVAVPLFADESCHTTADLPRLRGLYQGINIKLDKTGGLTEALSLARAARGDGLGVMVGCMAGTSLSMAPAYIIGSLADWVDLDGPLLLARDRPSSMIYGDTTLSHFSPDLWG